MNCVQEGKEWHVQVGKVWGHVRARHGVKGLSVAHVNG